MIRKLKLTNFQGFKGEQEVRLAPLTLVFGPNSAGKSSIGRALRLFKQSKNRGSLGFNFVGPEIDLTSAKNTIFGHGASGISRLDEFSGEPIATLGIELTLDFNSGMIPNSLTRHTFEVDCYLGSSSPDSLQEVTSSFQLLSQSGSLRILGVMDQEWTLQYDNSQLVSLLLDFESAKHKKDQKKLLILNKLFPSDTTLFRQRLESTNFLKDVDWSELGISDGGVFAFGNASPEEPPCLCEIASAQGHPLEFVPELSTSRTFFDNLETEDLLESWVRDVFTYLIHSGSSNLLTVLENIESSGNLRRVPPRYELMAQTRHRKSSDIDYSLLTKKWLFELSGNRYIPNRHFSPVEGDNGGTFLVSNFLKDTFTEAELGFSDVGTGISQILPILDVLGQEGKNNEKVLLLEQPELHLHPKMQSDFASILVEATSNQEIANQVIVETHSEAVLLKIQKLIREGAILADHATIVFVEPSPIDADDPQALRHNLMRNIEFTREGELSENPVALSFAGLRLADLLDD